MSFVNVISLNTEMEHFQREEQEQINTLVDTLMNGINNETLLDHECEVLESSDEIMGEDFNDSVMAHYSDISSPEASSSEGKPPFPTTLMMMMMSVYTLTQWKQLKKHYVIAEDN